MNKAKVAALIAGSALVIGIAADVLMRWIPWGLNVPVFVGLCLVAAVVAMRATGRTVNAFAAIAASLGALGIVWRDAEPLIALDVFLLLLFLPMLAIGTRDVKLAKAGLSQIGFATALTSLQAVAGLPQLLVSDLPWKGAPRTATLRTGGVILRGVLIAAPALFVFGALLSSADATFAKLIGNIFTFNVKELVLHVVVTAVAAAICAGYLRSFALSGAVPMLGKPSFIRLPAAEASIAIGLIDVLFATFVAIQFRYFFGELPNMTHAEYARRGFFELAWVVTLVMPMLLVVEWLVGKSTMFRVLAGIQIALVLVIAASAYHRMALYRDEFGLTRDRVLTTAFMIWVALLLLWFAATVLAGQRERFAAGVLASGVAAVMILHAINPDALIVRTNLERATAGKRPFDVRYALTLSDDAAEELIRAGYGPEVAKRVRPKGWRTWNVSRARAAN